MTKDLVAEAVDRYFEALAEDIACGEWIDVPGIGKDGQRLKRRVTRRLRTKVRLYEKFKKRVRLKS